MENLPKNWVLSYLYEVIQPVKTGVREFYDLKDYFIARNPHRLHTLPDALSKLHAVLYL